MPFISIHRRVTLTSPWAAVCLFYLFITTFLTCLNLPPQTFSDSASYRSGNGISNFNWISLSGSGYSRGWPIELLYSIFKTDSLRIISQSLIATLAVISLATTVYIRRSINARNEYLAYFILVLAQARPALMWNNYVSRESFSNSLFILTVALVIHSSGKSRQKNPALVSISLGIVSAIAIVTKPIFLPVSVILIAFQIFIIFRNSISNFKKMLLIVLLIVFAGYGMWNSFNQNIGWSHADPTGRTLKEISYSYVVSDFNPSAENFISFLAKKNEIPKCALPAKPLDTSKNLGFPMDHAADLRAMCPGFSEWVKNNYTRTYIDYAVQNPSSIVKAVYRLGEASFIFVGDGHDHSPLSQWLGNALFLDFIPMSGDPMLLLSALILFFSVLNIQRRPKIENRKSRNNFLIVILLTSSALLSVSLSVLLQPTHVGDLSRQNFTFNLFLRSLLIWQLYDFVWNSFSKLRGISNNENLRKKAVSKRR